MTSKPIDDPTNDEAGQPELIGVREAAERLGVHENTVRNWAREGLLPSARLPGSRVHRFDVRDVERLRRRRGAAVVSLEDERRTIGPELVDASQLNQWADTREAQSAFPELMRRLLASTPGVTNLSVRSGEGVAARGWDGRAESAGSSYLPAGSLCFEFGVGRQPRKKAHADYEKRRADPAGARPDEVAFVFVTPRRWAGASEWAAQRRDDNLFRDVHVLDADDLAGWLQATPAVHYWISERLGRRPRDGETLEHWWTRFQAQTEPELPLALFRAGRDRASNELVDFLRDPAGVATVQAAWRDDAIAFIYATLTELRDRGDDDALVPPALIVRSPEVWERVVAEPSEITLLATFPNPEIPSALARRHRVLLPAGRDAVVQGRRIELAPPDRSAATSALESADLDHDQAYELSALARRNIPSLIRKLARDPRIARPRWAQQPTAATLGPLVLVGAWSVASEADIELVAGLASQPWPDVERTLLYWARSDDPPFVHPGDQWHAASIEEAFLLLGPGLTTTDLDTWRGLARDVLTELDPKLEMATDERPMAGALGVERRYSSVLRQGMADVLALVGSFDDAPLADGRRGSEHARAIVRDVLTAAAESPRGALWSSLSDILPRLAEAAPEVFLDAVQDELDRGGGALRAMFQDSEEGSWLYSSSPHTGLLWALETLCWSPDHLLPATRALAGLATLDPGGRLSNRPLQSLDSVLVGWIRHTAAPTEMRIASIDAICRENADVGWELVRALWPSHHATSSPPSRPRYRDWRPDTARVKLADWIAFARHLVDCAVLLAGDNWERWAELAEHLGPLPPDERVRLIDELEAFVNRADLDADGRLALWNRIDREIARHDQFATADWAMDADPLQRLRAIAARLEPTDDPARYAYLFEWRPDLPDVKKSEREDYDERLTRLRQEALKDTLERGSLEGVRNLAAHAPVPEHLGRTLADLAPERFTPQLLAWLDDDADYARATAAGWARRKLLTAGIHWLRQTLARPEAASPERRLSLALNAPANVDLWDLLASDEALADRYWSAVSPIVTPADAQRAAAELLARGRAWIAVDMLAMTLHGEPAEEADLSADLITRVLDHALTEGPASATGGSPGYEVGVLLDYLEQRDVGDELLARYEFLFFRLLDHYRQPRALFAALAEQPSFFVDLVKRVYRGRAEQKRQLDERDAALAHHAWWVLENWRQLPGLREDGTVDGPQLTKWVREARLQLADADRADIGDEQVGTVLSSSPQGIDGIWPAEPVRDLIETVGSTSLEAGIHVGVVNARGVTSRGIYDGGIQERQLAGRYRQWAKDAAAQWPRTARVLRRLAEDYERQAEWEDRRAQVTADTE